jgi:hypothetical protein
VTQAAPVQVDLERGEVTLGAGTDRAAAADAIRRAGFTVEG